MQNAAAFQLSSCCKAVLQSFTAQHWHRLMNSNVHWMILYIYEYWESAAINCCSCLSYYSMYIQMHNGTSEVIWPYLHHLEHSSWSFHLPVSLGNVVTVGRHLGLNPGRVEDLFSSTQVALSRPAPGGKAVVTDSSKSKGGEHPTVTGISEDEGGCCIRQTGTSITIRLKWSANWANYTKW